MWLFSLNGGSKRVEVILKCTLEKEGQRASHCYRRNKEDKKQIWNHCWFEDPSFFLLNISLSIVWYTFSSRRLSNPVHRHFVFFLLCYIVLPKCKWQLESKRSQRFTMCSWQEVKVQSWVADHLQGAGFKFKVLVTLINKLCG